MSCDAPAQKQWYRDPGAMWPIVVGLCAAWLYLTPALYEGVLRRELGRMDLAYILVTAISPSLGRSENMVMYYCGVLAIVAALCVSLPSIVAGRFTRGSMFALVLATAALATVGYCGVWSYSLDQYVDAIGGVCLGASLVLCTRWRRLHWLQEDVGCRLGKAGWALCVMIAVIDVFVLVPMTTAVWAAGGYRPSPETAILYVMQMRDHESPLHNKLVRVFLATPSHFLVQQYPSGKRDTFVQTTMKLLSEAPEEISHRELADWLREVDTEGKLLPLVRMAGQRFVYTRPPVLVSRDEVVAAYQVAAPVVFEESIRRVIGSKDIDLAHVVEFDDAGRLVIDVHPADEAVCFGFSRQPDGIVTLTTQPATQPVTTSQPSPRANP